METLVAAGADVKSRDLSSSTPAFWSSLDCPSVLREMINLLLKHGLRVDETSGPQSPLFGIVSDPEYDTKPIETFIAAGARVTATDADLPTPLHFAAHPSLAETSFQHGANLSTKDIQGRTPLCTASRDGRLRVCPRVPISKTLPLKRTGHHYYSLPA